jgi:hypothetical protein
MSEVPFVVAPQLVEIPAGLSADPVTMLQQVWQEFSQYWNTGAPAQLDTLATIDTITASALR